MHKLLMAFTIYAMRSLTLHKVLLQTRSGHCTLSLVSYLCLRSKCIVVPTSLHMLWMNLLGPLKASNLWSTSFPNDIVHESIMVPMEHFRGSRDTKVISEVPHGWLMLFSCQGLQYSQNFCKVSFDSFSMCR